MDAQCAQLLTTNQQETVTEIEESTSGTTGDAGSGGSGGAQNTSSTAVLTGTLYNLDF